MELSEGLAGRLAGDKNRRPHCRFVRRRTTVERQNVPVRLRAWLRVRPLHPNCGTRQGANDAMGPLAEITRFRTRFSLRFDAPLMIGHPAKS